MASPPEDSETAQQFEGRMMAMTENCLTCFPVVLGHRLGLFDLLIELGEPQTPQQLAKAAGMKTRYIEEWIGALFCGHILEVDKTGSEDRYFVPSHRIPYLTNREHTAIAQGIPVATAAYEDLVKCFPEDGPRGIAYDRYPFFNEWRHMVGSTSYSSAFFKEGFQKYQPLHDKMSAGSKVLSIGCGSGAIEMNMAKAFPDSTFLGVDISEDGIATANQTAQDEGLSNISFTVCDASTLPAAWTDSFDIVVSFDCIHDVPDATKCVADCFRVTKNDGLFVLLETECHSKISENRSTFFSASIYSFSLLHCMPVSVNVEGGEGLGAMWGKEKVKEKLASAGFHVYYEVFTEKQFNRMYVCGKNKK